MLEAEEVREHLMDAMQKLWEECAPYTAQFNNDEAAEGVSKEEL